MKRVYVPTWSSANGQDDVQWYIAEAHSDGTYRQHIKASNHKNSTGEYNVHVYYLNSADQLQVVANEKTTVSVNKPLGNVSIQNNNKETGEFDVVISDIVAPQGLKHVYVPTWSSVNGQDDVQWYIAEKQADGTYRQHVKSINHKNSTGEYNVHLEFEDWPWL